MTPVGQAEAWGSSHTPLAPKERPTSRQSADLYASPQATGGRRLAARPPLVLQPGDRDPPRRRRAPGDPWASRDRWTLFPTPLAQRDRGGTPLTCRSVGEIERRLVCGCFEIPSFIGIGCVSACVYSPCARPPGTRGGPRTLQGCSHTTLAQNGQLARYELVDVYFVQSGITAMITCGGHFLKIKFLPRTSEIYVQQT